ncbi:MAG TPA: L-histidine N(alpha)-methyltransferase [Candidatus Saccharimonadales bacterium]
MVYAIRVIQGFIMYIEDIDLPTEAYEVLNAQTLQSIMSSLTSSHELPLRFSYLGEGATRWDNAITVLSSEKQKALLPNYASILKSLWECIGDSPVNVIDLGPGNGLQAKELIDQLQSKDQLHAYVGADISSKMLVIASKNVRDWTHSETPVITHVKDFIKEDIDDIFNDEQLGTHPRVVLILGGTLDNDASPVEVLRKISQYLRPKDLLLYDVLTPIDAPSSQAAFLLSPRHSYLLELLGIRSDLYKTQRIYDASSHTRVDQIIPTADIELTYKINNIPRVATLREGEPITIWRYHSISPQEAKDNLQQSGLRVIATSDSKERRSLLFLCAV